MKRLVFLLCFFVVFSVVRESAAEPSVSNVQAFHRADGSKAVDINCDSSVETSGRTMEVYSTLDGGAAYGSAESVTGDVGEGVSPGWSRQVVWNAEADVPDTGDGCRVKVEAVPPWEEFGIVMVPIPPGSFLMGDIQGGGDSKERPVHEVVISIFEMSA